MAKANRTSFKKGQVANPNGRGKGTLNKTTIERAMFQSLAVSRYEEAFETLWRNLTLGEGWAHQIYFNKLLPKSVYQPTVQVKIEEGKTRLESVTAALSGFTELTHEEAMEEIKALRPIETKEELIQQENIFDVIPEELTKQVIEAYNKNKKIDL